MGTVLDRIVAAHREAAAADTRDLGQLKEEAAEELRQQDSRKNF